MTMNTAFKDLPEEAYPFLVQYYRMDTQALLGWTAVLGPGVMEVVGHGNKGYEVEVVVWHPTTNYATRTRPDGKGGSNTEAAKVSDEGCEAVVQLINAVKQGLITNGEMEEGL